MGIVGDGISGKRKRGKMNRGDNWIGKYGRNEGREMK